MIGNLLYFLASFSLPGGLMCGMWKINSRRWTHLAQS